MAAETQYIANTGVVTISTANTNLDGSGTLGTVLTADQYGTLVKSVTIKAQVSTTAGMVRLYITDGGGTKLVAEIEIPAVTKSATAPSFEAYIETNFALAYGDILKASTEKGEAFNVIAEGLDWLYYGSVRAECTEYTANTGNGNVATANSNLDGSGTLATILTAPAGNGTNIKTITLKAQVTTTAGMIRLYIYNGGTNYLFKEIPVPAVTKSATANSFSSYAMFNGNDFALKGTYLLKASTEKAESINVIAEGLDWAYPA